MKPFTYEPLDFDSPAFRLLRLVKGEGPVLQGEIFQAWFHQREEVIPYEALSYTWGFQDLSNSIEVNGRELGITTNLYLALQSLRYHDQDRILWVDAVCIDQGNLKERGHQVQQMGDIYRQAQSVIFWLGQATYETNVVMDYLQQLQKESLKHACKDWMPSDKRWQGLWTTIRPILQRKHAGPEAQLSQGLQTLLDRPWFSRVWILQEVANAKVAFVRCGAKSIRAGIFALAPQLITATVTNHCESVLDIMPSASRKNSWWGQNRDLHTLLQKFRDAEAHDSRDMIYALLGMSSDANNSAMLRPDYGMSEGKLIGCVIAFLRSRGVSVDLAHSSAIRDFLRQFDPNFETTTYSKVRFKTTVGSMVESPVERLEPIISAAQKGDKSAVRLLLNKGAYIESKDSQGRTPLSCAVQEGHEALVKLLLEKGSNIDSKDIDGRTPLFWAVKKGRLAVTQLLLGNFK